MNCTASLSNIFYVVKNIVNIIMIITPIIAIIIFSILLIKMTFSPDEKKIIKKLTNSVSALVILFFIPMLLTIVMYACPESACQTGPSLELSCRLEAGGCAVRASPGRLGSLAQPQRRGTSP